MLTNCSWYIHNHIRYVISFRLGHFQVKFHPIHWKKWTEISRNVDDGNCQLNMREMLCTSRRERFIVVKDCCAINAYKHNNHVDFMLVYLLIHRNAFTIAYIIILKDTCAKSTCRKSAISQTLLTKWLIHMSKSMFFCSPPLPNKIISDPPNLKYNPVDPVPPNQNSSELCLPQIKIHCHPPEAPSPPNFNRLLANDLPPAHTFISGITRTEAKV